MRAMCLLIFILLIAACDRSPTTESVEPEAKALEFEEVTASDELSGFSDIVRGVDFWAHPTLPFNGLMVVAESAAMTAYNIEDGVEVERVDAISPDGVSIGYVGAGANAAGVAAVFDRTLQQFRFYRIDNVSREFLLAPTLMVASDAVVGHCIGRRRDDGGLALYAITPQAIERYDLTVSESGVSATRSLAFAAPAPLIDCAVDEIDGSVFAATESGVIYKLSKSGEIAAFASANISSAKSIALTYSGLEPGAPTNECCGWIALLSGEDGAVHVFDRDDGAAAGVVRLSASFDVEAVSQGAAMGLGSGNFGGAYRNGVLAIATENGDEFAVRLAPWNGVLNMLDQPVGASVTRRSIGAEDEPTSEPVIDLDALDP